MSERHDNSLSYAVSLDNHDPLRKFRREFLVADEDIIYLDGNSLGRLPLSSSRRMEQVVEYEWGERLIRSWNEGWYERSQKTGAAISPLIGAGADEVIVADSTSVNLYKLAYAAMELQQGRKRIVSDVFNFPTDLYILQGVARQTGAGCKVDLVESQDGIHILEEDVREALDENVALLVLSHVAFKSGFMYDMKKITRIAHDKGVMVLWDLSHSAGSTEVDLRDANADMAVGCTYKYLNGGPGSPAFLYVRKDLIPRLRSPIEGWFGHSDPFAFRHNYDPSDGIRKFLTGTPPLLSLSAVESSLQVIQAAGMPGIREKSVKQTEFLTFLIERMLESQGFRVGSPADPRRRGSHVALLHEEAWRICQALINPPENVPVIIPDFRAPDVIRLGIAPLYTRYTDLYVTVERIRSIVKEKEYESFDVSRPGVT